jgi:O-antigen ligase
VKRKAPPTETAADPRWTIRLAALGFFLGQIAVLPGAESPFRLPKEAVVLAVFCLVAGFAGAGALRRGTLSLPRGRLFVVLISLPILQFVSALWSANPRRTLEAVFLTSIWIAGTLWLASLKPESRRRLALVAALGATVSATVMVLQGLGVEVLALTGQFAEGRFRLTGLSGNPADLAMATVLLLPLLLVWGEESKTGWLYRTIAVILAFAALLTQTLTGVVALALMLAVLLIQRRSRTMWLTTLGITSVLIAIALATGLGSRIQSGVDAVRGGDWYRLFSARADGWTAATEMIRERPITGVGGANYTQRYYPSRVFWLTRQGGTGHRGEVASHFQWAHSDPLQQAAELGVLGVLWMLALIIVAITLRKRAGPVLPVAIAAFLPFAAIHYPTHLAVGLAPITLVLAHLLALDPPRPLEITRARGVLAALLVVLAVAGALWQLRRMALDLWIGGLEQRLMRAQTAEPVLRPQMIASIEAQILPRVGRLPGAAPTLWRIVGRARLFRGDPQGSEKALRTAFARWPHEDADYFLGLALAAQGRRGEALRHLGRVCRTNPALVNQIPDTDLRRNVQDMVDTYRKR